ncbi:MAG: Hsp70 family protein [Maribacter arcticus]|uniref:Hsp70 family protein n=1 Tax=Maribacter arcticus TaxID=561365 RepID=UPI0030034413
MKSKSYFHVVLIGGGPGSEAYGIIKYILDYCPNIKNISIDILDINANTWNYSHSALTKFLLPELDRYNEVSITLNSHLFNLVDADSIKNNISVFKSADIVVIQNCINEIEKNDYKKLEQNVLEVFELLPNLSSLLMIDLTTSVRSKIAHLEHVLENRFKGINKISTSKNNSASSMVSINSRPSQVIRENLLDFTDGLMPRKNLKYDFSLLSKGISHVETKEQVSGINSIYRPLTNIKNSVKDLTNRCFIGFDFGTSSSVCSIAYVKNNLLKVDLLEIQQKDHLGAISSSTIVPSIMGIVDNRFLLGRYAEERRSELHLGENGWYGFKRNLLKLKDLNYPNSRLYNHAEFPINNAANALVVFFKRLKSEIDRIAAEKGMPFEKRISFSTPANYGLKEKELLEGYILEAGYEKNTFSFVEEPISSILGTIYQEDLTLQLKNDSNILVIDVGAGTVDCCAIKLSKDTDNIIAETLATFRNENIGGNFLNKLIANRLFEKDNKIIIDEDFVLKNCEEIKLQFCKSFMVDAQVSYALPDLATSNQNKNCHVAPYGKGNSLQLSYYEVHEIMKTYFEGNAEFKGFKASIKDTLSITGLKHDNFDYVIISGGGAKNPYLRALCANYFSSSKIIIPNNSQEQVAIGNAIQSFVANAFGKQIISSVLNGNIFLIKNARQKLIFKKGETLPSLEYEITIENGISPLVLYFDMTDEYIHFDLSQHDKPIKIILKVSHESRIICDLVTHTSINRITPQIKKK